MTRYERLIDEIDNSDIELLETDSLVVPAHSVCVDGECCIAFNESAFVTTAERHVALAHEKAHCETGSFYTFNSPLLTYEVNEAKAWRKTIGDAMTFKELSAELPKHIYADGLDIYDLAEHFNLPAEFMKKVLDHHCQEGERW